MKKALSVLLVLAVALVCLAIPAFATGSDGVVISGGTVTAEPGDTVEISVVIESNSGFCGLNLYFTYSDALTLVSLENSVSALTCTNDATTVWDGAQNYTGTGELAVLKFEVSDTAEYGARYEIQIHFVEAYDYDLNDVDVQVSSGYITVACSHMDTVDDLGTDATCVDSGYTAGVFCNDCLSYISGHEMIPATGDHVDENGDWEIDGTGHHHTCGCGLVLDRASHIGGEASCVTEAVCQVCGAVYGTKDPDAHGRMELRDVADGNCIEDGYTGDTWCLDCGKMIAPGSVIPAPGYHTGGEATCTELAVCEACGITYGSWDMENHKGATEIRGSIVADCGNVGYTGDTCCVDCGNVIAVGSVIGTTGDHIDANVDGVCDICGAEQDIPAPVKPDTPQIQFCYSQKQDSVRVQWDLVDGADGYQLYRSISADGSTGWSCVKTITSSTQNTYQPGPDGGCDLLLQGPGIRRWV